MATSDQPNPLRICTYNIRFILDRWGERCHLLQEIFDATKADIFCLQEVLVSPDVGQPQTLLSSLNKNQQTNYRHYDIYGILSYFENLPYGLSWLFSNPLSNMFFDCCALFNEKYFSAIVGKYVQILYYNKLTRVIVTFALGTCWVFGTSILLNTKNLSGSTEIEHRKLLIGSWKTAHGVIFQYQTRRIFVVNLHLTSDPLEEHLRMEEVRLVCEWTDTLFNTSEVEAVIITGDFNSKPDSLPYLYFLDRGYSSAYKACHGSEPPVTFHQNHTCDTKDIDDECTLDYIFFKGCVVPSSYSQPWLIGCDASADDPTLYPSDHYGIAADFTVI
jgi:endonuclease/exonuclease/phosphatase family metal-dependent hydrolase